MNFESDCPSINENEDEFPRTYDSSISFEPSERAVFADSEQHNGSEIVLLVEDEAFVRRVTAEVLESAGYHVIVAAGAVEALRASSSCSTPIDLLVSDVVLPGMSGPKLAELIEASHPSARILLMSGYPEQLTLCATSDPGGRYLAKPFSVQSLLRMVRDTLGKTTLSIRAQA